MSGSIKEATSPSPAGFLGGRQCLTPKLGSMVLNRRCRLVALRQNVQLRIVTIELYLRFDRGTHSPLVSTFLPTCEQKTDRAKRNEVVRKILCHNICCLIHAQFELGIFPEFWSKLDIVVPRDDAVA